MNDGRARFGTTQDLARHSAAAVLCAATCFGLPVVVATVRAESTIALCRDPAPGDAAVGAFCTGLDKDESGDKAGALADFERAAALQPEMPEPHLMLGIAYADEQDYVRAIREYDLYLAAVPENPAAWSNRAHAYFKLGDLAAARADIDRAAQLAPDERTIIENRIVIARQSADWPTVVSDASHLLEQFPNDAALRLERGKALANLDAFESAREDFDRAVVLSPSAEAYYFRGRIHYELGRDDAAIYDFSKAIELDAELVDAYRRRAFAEYRQQRYLGAAQDCAEYARLRPEDGEGYYCRGIMLSRAGDQDAAIADYRRAIELAQSPSMAGNAWYGVGLCHERAQRMTEAIAAYRKAVELYPDQAQARAALERLTKPK